MTTLSEEAPSKKKKETTAYPSCGLCSLPDELALSCLARVSKLDHPSLSLVSKRYHSLMVSPELYGLRSSLGRTENLLYVCLRTPPDTTPRWFVHTSTTRLVQIPLLPYMPWEASSVVLLKNLGIYVIGGIVNGKASSGAFLLDCRSHKWSHVPSMRVARASAITGVVNGMIYVFGGCRNMCSSDWGEVFDPKMQTWETLSMPEGELILFSGLIRHSLVMDDDKICAVNQFSETIYYSPSKDKWEQGNWDIAGGTKRGWRVIDKLLYSCHVSGKIMWSEPKELEKSNSGRPVSWKEVKGLESLREKLSYSKMVHYVWGNDVSTLGFNKDFEDQLPGFKLCNSGGNIVLYWDVLVGGLESLEIWCAEISLERRMDDIWGTLLCSNVVMTLDPLLYRFKLLYSLSVKV